MATNQYFRQGISSEQSLYEDLVIESIKIYGQDVYYLPKTIISKNELFGEQSGSSFNSAKEIEMYLESVNGSDGQGNLFEKFGIEIRDSITLVVPIRRWSEEFEDGADVGSPSTENRPRPFEGDLIYFSLAKQLYEVKFVEHEVPFYQLNHLNVYRLELELFEYAGESINTGIEEIDQIEWKYGSGGIKIIGAVISEDSPIITIDPDEYFILGETYTGTGVSCKLYYVESTLDPNRFIMDLGQIKGTQFIEGIILEGSTTGNHLEIVSVYDIDNSETDQEFIPEEDGSTSDNVTIEKAADHIVDNSENQNNPFGFI